MTAGINRQGRCDHQNEAGQRNLAHVEAGSISEEQRRQSGRSGFRTPTHAIAKGVATGGACFGGVSFFKDDVVSLFVSVGCMDGSNAGGAS